MQIPSAAAHAHPPRTRLLTELVALLFAVPLLQATNHDPVRSFNAEWAAGLILCLAALVAPWSARRGWSLQWPLPAWLFGFFLVASAQFALRAIGYSGTWVGLCAYLFALLTAYALGRLLVANDLRNQAVAIIAMALLFAGSLSVVLQWLQTLGVSRLPDWLLSYLGPNGSPRPSANTGGPNLLATLLGASLAATALLFRLPRHAAWRLLLCAWLSFGISWTLSRLGMVYVGLFCLLPFMPSALRPARMRDRAMVCVCVLGGFALGSALPPLSVQPALAAWTSQHSGSAAAQPPAGAGHPATAPQPPAASTTLEAARANSREVIGKVLQNAGSRTETIGIRLKLWRDALSISLQHPLFGVGFGQYARAQFWSAPPGPFLVATNNVHNAVLQVAAEMGWPLALALAAYVAWWFAAGWRIRTSEPHLAFCWLVVALVALHSLEEWPMWLLHVAVPTILLIALAEPTLRGSIRVPAPVLAALGATGLAVAVWFRIDFDRIANAYETFFIDERAAQRAYLVAADTSRFSPFRPHAASLQFFLLDAAGENSAQTRDLAERVLTWAYQPHLCARYLADLIKAGQIEPARRLAARLGMFSWENLDTRESHAWIRSAILEAGPGGGPVLAAFDKSSRATLTGAVGAISLESEHEKRDKQHRIAQLVQ